jgi:hypothetical protein
MCGLAFPEGIFSSPAVGCNPGCKKETSAHRFFEVGYQPGVYFAMKPIFFFLFFLFAAPSTHAANFRCVSPNGKVSYQEMPCEKQAKVDAKMKNDRVSEQSKIEARNVANKNSKFANKIEQERRRH